MAAIHDLPGELLADIAEYLEYDRPALYNLTLVSHRWRPIAEKLLYRHIEPLTRRSSNWYTGQACYILLHRSFDENPELRRHVRSCNALADSVTGGRKVMLRGAEDGGNTLTHLNHVPNIYDLADVQIYRDSLEPTHQLNAYLLQYPNLKGLHITYPTRVKLGHSCPCALVNGLLTPIFEPATIQNITFVTWLRIPTFHEMLVFMMLPNIRTITANKFSTRTTGSIKFSEDAPKSTLRSLVLFTRNGSPISEGIVHKLLLYCTSLEELRWIPYLKDPEELASYFSHPLRARSQPTLDALDVVKDTLKLLELAIEDPTSYLPWHRIGVADGIPINLTFLRCLRYLKINAFLLLPYVQMWNSSVQESFGEWKRHVEQKGPHLAGRHRIHELIPSSIKTLHIVFPHHYALFNELYAPDYTPADPESYDIPRGRYDWILQFAIAKENALKNLHHVLLQDDPRYFQRLVFRRKRITFKRQASFIPWEQPPDVVAAFTSARVRLDVQYGVRCDVLVQHSTLGSALNSLAAASKKISSF